MICVFMANIRGWISESFGCTSRRSASLGLVYSWKLSGHIL